MTTGLDLLEHVFHQLHAAGLVGSKAEFSSRLHGKSPSYLTSMRTRQRKASTETITALDAALRSEVRARRRDQDVEDRIILRRAMAEVVEFLGNYPLSALLRGVEAFSESPPSQNEAFSLRERQATPSADGRP